MLSIGGHNTYLWIKSEPIKLKLGETSNYVNWSPILYFIPRSMTHFAYRVKLSMRHQTGDQTGITFMDNFECTME
jgi:hypothetical protein